MRCFHYSLILLSFFVISCTSSSSQKVGFLIRSYNIERCAKERDFFLQKAKELNMEVLVADANDNDQAQYNQSIEMMDQGVSVLVIFPVNQITAAAIIREAKSRGVKTIAYESIIQGDVDYFVTADNGKGGEMMAEYVSKVCPKGNYVIIGGDKNDKNAVLIKEGNYKVLKPLEKQGAIKIVYDVYADWTADEGYFETQRFLNFSGIVPDVIMSSNDGLATGVIKALTESNLAGKVAVTGLDGELSALRRVAKGTQLLTIYKSLKTEAFQAAEMASQLAKGEKLQLTAKTSNGTVDVPTFLINPILVTKDNLKEVVSKETSYKEADIWQ